MKDIYNGIGTSQTSHEERENGKKKTTNAVPIPVTFRCKACGFKYYVGGHFEEKCQKDIDNWMDDES